MITRYYSYELNGLKFEVEPPKLKTLRKLTEIIKEQKTELTTEDLDNLIEVLVMILTKNKNRYKVSKDFVEDNFDIDNLYEFFNGYVNWVSEIQNEKN